MNLAALFRKNQVIVIMLTIVLILLVAVLWTSSSPRESFKTDTRIIGGAPIDHQHIPFFVEMQLKLPGSTTWEHACGGTLISDRHVLTAAHCVAGMRKMRREGWKVSFLVWQNGRTRRVGISRIRRYPGTHEHTPDVAVVKLRRSVQNATILNLATTLPNPNDHLLLVGRGLYMNEGGVEYLPKDIQMTWLRVERIDHGNVIVTLNEGTSGCPGDSGGPLLKDGFVYGIVSGPVRPGNIGFHGRCEKTADNMYAGEYTAVAPFVSWIRETMNQLGF